MVTTAIVFSMMGMAVVAVPIMHYALRYNVILILVAAILQALSGLFFVLCSFLATSFNDLLCPQACAR